MSLNDIARGEVMWALLRGSLYAIGFLAVLAEEKFLLGPTARVFLMIGFCGAFTTFSSFILETSNLTKDGENLYAFMNIALSVILGFLLFRLGVMFARWI